MEFKLQLPDRLARRLRHREEELPELLELGLRAAEEREPWTTHDSEDDDSAGLPPEWRSALAEVMRQRQDEAETPSVSADEILLYQDGGLSAEEEEEKLERILADPDAFRDLLDYADFRREAEGDVHTGPEPSDALKRFRATVAKEQPESRGSVWMALAAALVIALGLVIYYSMMNRSVASEPFFASVIDVSTSRGARPFPVTPGARVLLILPPETEVRSVDGRRIEILDIGGNVIFAKKYRSIASPDSRLSIPLPGTLLEPGTYRVRITADASGEGGHAVEEDLVQEYRFSIDDATAR